MSEQRFVALTDRQIETLKGALQAVQEGYRLQGGGSDVVDHLLDEAYRALSVELIQRIPAPGDRWRGLDRKDLEGVLAALSFFEEYVRKEGRGTNPDRDHLTALLRDGADEMERRRPGWLDEPQDEPD